MTDPRRPTLETLLSSFAPGSPEAEAFRRSTLEYVRASGRPFDRDRFDPGHVTASAFVLHPDGRHLLLVLHKTIGRWVQPGGHVDPGDVSAVAAARREAIEESGVTGLEPMGEGLLDVDVHAYPGKPGGDPPHAHLDLRFAFRAADDVLNPDPEVDDAGWFDAEGLVALRVDASVLRPAGLLLSDLS